MYYSLFIQPFVFNCDNMFNLQIIYINFQVYFMSQQVGVSQVLGECDRLRGHPQLLHRPGAAEALVTHQER